MSFFWRFPTSFATLGVRRRGWICRRFRLPWALRVSAMWLVGLLAALTIPQAASRSNPVATATAPANFAHTGGLSVTILGWSFDETDCTPTATLGRASLVANCGTSFWTSSTTIQCSLDGAMRSAQSWTTLQVGGVTFVSGSVFTQDGLLHRRIRNRTPREPERGRTNASAHACWCPQRA